MSPFQAQRQATRNPDDGKANLVDVLSLEFTYASTGIGLRLPLAATAANPIALLNVALIITTGFGVGKTVDIGDDAGTPDVDAYIDQTDLDEDVVGAMAQSLQSANAKAMGEYMTTAHDIIVTLGGSPTAGAATLLAKIARL